MDTIASFVVYEDQEIQVLWSSGSSAFVLITFGDLTTTANGVRFFADTPVKRLGIACIGIMPRSANWYPAASLEKAASIIRSFTGKYEDRVLYGGSMGGYGAVKYSALLEATVVIALCPQHSINPAECLSDDPWRGFFRQKMTGMAVRTKDVQGKHYIFYDPHNRIDRFHFEQIRLANNAVHALHVPFVGHNVTTTFAGTQHLATLIEASKTEDLQTILRFVRDRRRFSRARVETVLRYAVRTRLRTCIDLLDRIQNKHAGVLSLFRFKDIVSVVDQDLSRSKDLDRAAILLRRFIGLSDTPDEQAMAAMLLSELVDCPIEVVTHHKTVIFYDPHLAMVVHGQPPKRGTFFKLGFDLCGRNLEPFVKLGSSRVRLYVNKNGMITSEPDGEDASNLYLRFEPASAGAFSLTQRGLFMTAEINGQITVRRESAKAWEIFRFHVQH